MDHLRDHGERLYRPRPYARDQQEVGEVGWAPVGCGGECAVQAAEDHVLRSRTWWITESPGAAAARHLAPHNAVRPEVAQEVELGPNAMSQPCGR